MTSPKIFAMVVFTYFSGLGLLISLLWTFNQSAAYKMLSQAAGFGLQQTASTSEQAGKAMSFLLVDFTSQMLGFNLLGLFIYGFLSGRVRCGHGLHSGIIQIMFVWHYLHYAKGTKFSRMQIVYFLLGSAALVLTYPQLGSPE